MNNKILKAVGKGSICSWYQDFLKYLILAFGLLLGVSIAASAQTREPVNQATVKSAEPNYASEPTWKTLKGELSFYMTNDMGRNGYYDQKPIAELMGRMAGTVDPQCVLAVGDIHLQWHRISQRPIVDY